MTAGGVKPFLGPLLFQNLLQDELDHRRFGSAVRFVSQILGFQRILGQIIHLELIG